MSLATNAVVVGTAARDALGARMDAREFAGAKRCITQLLDVDDSAADDAAVLDAAAAADTFNAEASDSRLLLAAAEHELRTFGAVCESLANALRERAGFREARRLELVSRHTPLLF